MHGGWIGPRAAAAAGQLRGKQRASIAVASQGSLVKPAGFLVRLLAVAARLQGQHGTGGFGGGFGVGRFGVLWALAR